jgi:hypothetical protein
MISRCNAENIFVLRITRQHLLENYIGMAKMMVSQKSLKCSASFSQAPFLQDSRNEHIYMCP